MSIEKLKTEYEKLKKEKNDILEQSNILEGNQFVKRYFNLQQQSKNLENKERLIFIEIKNNEFANCQHIWITTNDNKQHKTRACIKCGLNEEYLFIENPNEELISLEEQLAYNFMHNNQYCNGIELDITCTYDLARKIYLKLKENYLDDETLCKYFLLTLDGIKENDDNQSRIIRKLKPDSSSNDNL